MISLGLVRPVDASRPPYLSYNEDATAGDYSLLKMSSGTEPLGNKHLVNTKKIQVEGSLDE